MFPISFFSYRLRNSDLRGSLLATGCAEIKNLRAYFTQEKVNNAGNRTHAYLAQKRTIYPPN